MINRILVVPKQGLVIKNPLNKMPLVQGKATMVDLNQYWLRRLADGDVTQKQAEGKPKVMRSVQKEAKKVEKKSDQKSDS